MKFFQILCITCFGLAIVLFSKDFALTTRVLLIVVTTVFLFITFVDVISWIVLTPMNMRTWIMIAVAAVLMFWSCGVLLILMIIKGLSIILLVAAIFNLITGFVYLWEFTTLVL